MLLTQLAAVFATGLVFGVSANPVPAGRRQVPNTHMLHERHLPQHSAHWSKRSRVPSTVLLPVRIGLTQGNLDDGHDRLLAISDKTSEHYGKHMTPEEVIDFFAPSQSLVDAVTDWVSSAGIAKERIGHSANKQWIQFDATTKEVEELLYAEFHVWEHVDGTRDVSTEEYHVPAEIREHIDYITPGIRLRAIKGRGESHGTKQRVDQSGRANTAHILPKPLYIKKNDRGQPQPFAINSTTCDVSIVADCIRHQYDVPKLEGEASPGNELGVFEHLTDHYSKHELDVFFSTVYPGIVPNGSYPIERNIDGAFGAVEDQPAGTNPPKVGGSESMLDFSAAIPLIYPQKTVLFQTDDEWYENDQATNPNTTTTGFFNTFLDAIDGSYCTYDGGDCTTNDCRDPIYPNPNPGGYKGRTQCGVYRPTNVISLSYGASIHPDKYMRRQCYEIMKLGLQGTTVIASSGDDGPGWPAYCPVGGADQLVFYTQMLAECPYTLAVGSTELNRPATGAPGSSPTKPQPFEKLDEVATAAFPSGGGFSNIFDAPDWQKAATAQYLASVKLDFTGYDTGVKDGDFTTVKGANQRFHKNGRGYPDIAAVGDRQVVFVQGLWWRYGGTSLSAPIVASLVTLVNEQRIRSGKKPVGFFTPALYAHPEVLHDITVGSSPGWDPVTGGGSIIFPKFSALLQSL
ncbi:tripeptidyl-peptidase I [Microdochium nivale]|nr:tripeptidyl-peptidase I [Microdochium nivale]